MRRSIVLLASFLAVLSIAGWTSFAIAQNNDDDETFPFINIGGSNQIIANDAMLSGVSAKENGQVTIRGSHVNGDVIVQGNAQVTLQENTNGNMPAVGGNLLGNGNSQLDIDTAKVYGNVNANGANLTIITRSNIEGNVVVTDNAVVAIDSKSVINGSLYGRFIGNDASGYAVFTAP